MSKTWVRWKSLSKKIGNFQIDVFLIVIYFLVIAPIAIFIKLFFRNFFTKSNFKRKTAFMERKHIEQNLDWARKQ